MSEPRPETGDNYHFHGQTTYINQPYGTLIENFQNAYLHDGNPQAENLERLKSLVELLARSNDLRPEDKEEALEAVHDVAAQVSEGKGSKFSWRGTLNAVKELATGAADIARPTEELVKVIVGALT